MSYARKRLPLWLVLFLDFVIFGISICVFSYFHHVRVLWNLGNDAPAILTPAPPVAPSIPSDTSGGSEQQEADTPEEGQFGAKFPDRFAHQPDEMLCTNERYISEDLDVTLTTCRFTEEAVPVDYYVMDVYVRNIENLYTMASLTDRNYFTDMVAASGSVVAVSGDYCGNDKAAYEVLRNGVELRSSEYIIHDLCVLGYDGSLSVFTPENYQRDAVLAKNPYQIWNFGPILVENGINKTNFLKNYDIGGLNPRVALGEVEPGHYILVVVDGRNPSGMKLSSLARIMRDLGCVTAYNMDGGASAHGYFNGVVVRNGHGGDDPRKLFDIICIGEVSR